MLICIREQTTPDRVLPLLHWFFDSLSIAHQSRLLLIRESPLFTNANGIELLRSLPAHRFVPENDARFSSDGKSDKSFFISGMTSQLATLRDNKVEVMRSVLAQNASRVFEFAGIKGRFAEAVA